MTLRRYDIAAVLVLGLLWLLFFWRLFTPIESDQATLVNGDFSGQFVAFGAYQYERFAAGEIPLWNPYNNGGLPFIADTQAAVFYPPRLVTVALSSLAGGWSYHALELEMAVHVLAYSFFMYALVRCMLGGHPFGRAGAFSAAVIAAYGGFITSYPVLQLAILEAAVWLPLAVLGIFTATHESRIRWRWLAVTGFTLGLSWMAGHPQTSWFLTYLLIAYFAYRIYLQRVTWRLFVVGTTVFGVIAVGVVAVQLIPGLEYLARTARTDLGFDAKGSGFLYQDITQFLFPGLIGPWWPLFVGITGLALAMGAVWRKLPGSVFWGGVAAVALIMSVGTNGGLFHALYNFLPGLRFFRGQERAVFLAANSLAILAGMGAAHLLTLDQVQSFQVTRQIKRALGGLAVVCILTAGAVFFSQFTSAEVYTQPVSRLFFSAITIVVLYIFATWSLANPSRRIRPVLLAGLIIVEMFTVNIDNSNYVPGSPQQQLSMTPPPLIAQVLADTDGPFRVDGRHGLLDNYGSLYGVMDMRGISPLFLNTAYAIIEPEAINPLAWELFAVRYVYTDWDELPVPSDVIGTGEDRYGAIKLHRLSDPRPFAHLIYDAVIMDDDNAALTQLHDASFDPRRTIILNRDPQINLAGTPPDDARAIVTAFAPEQFTIEVSSPVDAILSTAHPDYPGWLVTLDDQPVDVLRAYGALTAVVVPAGEHTVRFAYRPVSFQVGALLSLFTWGGLGILGIVVFITDRRTHANEQ